MLAITDQIPPRERLGERWSIRLEDARIVGRRSIGVLIVHFSNIVALPSRGAVLVGARGARGPGKRCDCVGSGYARHDTRSAKLVRLSARRRLVAEELQVR